MEQVTYNQFGGAMSYANAQAVPAGGAVKLSSFRAPEQGDIKGLEFGADLSAATAWVSGASFTIRINNAQVLHISDALGDLLRPAFLPIALHGKDLVELEFQNKTAAAMDVASMLKVVML